MLLSLQTFSTLVQGMAAAVQSGATQALDLTVGSTLRAILEASASIALWMQWLILQVLQMTRAATSTGSDLDSWMADFSVTRLPATPASGIVTFSRFNSSAAALIPVNTLVRTLDGSGTFSVETDTSLPAWDPASNGYLLGAGTSSLDLPVVAQVAGTCGNVQAQSLTVLATALSGIDGVSNAVAFQNGIDAEADAALRLRFQSFMLSRSRATLFAVEYAIGTVQQGLKYTIQENQTVSGAFQLGNFIVVVDDGSGYPSSTLLSMVQQAVEAVRPVGSTFAVFAPSVTQVNVSLFVTTDASTNATLITPQITSAIGAYVDALSVGAPLPTSRIVQIAYTASPNVTNVTTVLLNGQALDVVVQPSGVIKIGTVMVS